MCQLLGMNSAAPSDFCVPFATFAQRGGLSDKHCDGWGLAFYDSHGLVHGPVAKVIGRKAIDLAHIRYTRPAAHCPVAKLIGSHPLKTHNMLAHIRLATQGKVNIDNVHPFKREMWGIQWCFAHNGDIPKFSNNRLHPKLGNAKKVTPTFHTVGETDSEAVFCAILNALDAEFSTFPTPTILYDAIKRLCHEIICENDSAIFNFLLSCGKYNLFAFSFPGARLGSDVWNGLFYTIRADKVAVIATKPLTRDEIWIEMKKGELLIFDKGVPYDFAGDHGC